MYGPILGGDSQIICHLLLALRVLIELQVITLLRTPTSINKLLICSICPIISSGMIYLIN